MKISLISENNPEFINIGADATVIEGNYPYLALYCFVKSRPGNSVELSKALFPTQKEPNKSFHIYHKLEKDRQAKGETGRIIKQEQIKRLAKLGIVLDTGIFVEDGTVKRYTAVWSVAS